MIIITPQIAPILWLVLGITLAVVEGLSVQLTAIWFALGAAAAAVAAVMGASQMTQVFVFLAVSAGTLIFTRPFVKKVLRVKKESTNADRVIGQTGIVLEAIDNDFAAGRVTVMGLDWSARTQENTGIAAGERVKVLAIDGVKLIVEPYTKQIETEE
ncbi:NfeD family protein [Oscillospiraceae bacterium PP1C4]